MSKKIRFQNELILHLLTQRHLKELFELKCVASEIQCHGQRLDTLAFDEKNNSFVIIEYKNRFNTNVLKQVENYRNLVLENENCFLERLENPKNVDIDNTRVMIISPRFSDNQIENAESYFELWQVSLYSDCHVEYEQLNTDEKKILNVKKDELKLTEDDLLKNKSFEIRRLYNALRKRVENEFSDVECKILVDAISLKTSNKIICNVNFLKNSFNVNFFTEKHIDSDNDKKHKYDLKIKTENDLNHFMKLFKHAYDKKVRK